MSLRPPSTKPTHSQILGATFDALTIGPKRPLTAPSSQATQRRRREPLPYMFQTDDVVYFTDLRGRVFEATVREVSHEQSHCRIEINANNRRVSCFQTQLRGQCGETALMKAVLLNRLDGVKRLMDGWTNWAAQFPLATIDAAADPLVTLDQPWDYEKQTHLKNSSAFILACKTSADMVTHLLNEYLEDEEIFVPMVQAVDEQEQSGFDIACKQADLSILSILCEKEVHLRIDINGTPLGRHGMRTAILVQNVNAIGFLHKRIGSLPSDVGFAIEMSSESIFNQVLSTVQNHDLQTYRHPHRNLGRITVLTAAVLRGYQNGRLLELLGNVQDESRCTTLIHAIATMGDDEMRIRMLPMVGWMLRKPDLDVNHSDSGGYTALMHAVSIQDVDCVNLLLPRSNISYRNPQYYERSALHMASAHPDIVSAIVTNITSTKSKNRVTQDAIRYTLNQRDVEGNTPLMLCCYNEYVDSLKILLNAGANYKLSNNEGRNAIMFAAWEGEREIVQLLLEMKLEWNLNQQDRAGKTLLMTACDHQWDEIVHRLVQKGVDVNIKTPQRNQNAYWWTRARPADENYQLRLYLIDNGVDVEPDTDEWETLTEGTPQFPSPQYTIERYGMLRTALRSLNSLSMECACDDDLAQKEDVLNDLLCEAVTQTNWHVKPVYPVVYAKMKEFVQGLSVELWGDVWKALIKEWDEKTPLKKNDVRIQTLLDWKFHEYADECNATDAHGQTCGLDERESIFRCCWEAYERFKICNQEDAKKILHVMMNLLVNHHEGIVDDIWVPWRNDKLRRLLNLVTLPDGDQIDDMGLRHAVNVLHGV